MKKILLILIVIVAFSCKNEVPIDYAIVSGKILNNKVKELSIESEDRKVNKKILIDSEGNFTDTIKATTGIFSFYDGKNYDNFYIAPSDNISINYDAKDFKNSLTYTGKGSEVSNYLLAKKKLTADMTGNRKDHSKLNEGKYKTKIQKIRDTIISLVSNFKGLPVTFVKNEKKDIHYAYLNDLSNYEYVHGYYTKNDTFKVPNTFLDELKGFDFNNEEDYFNSKHYSYLVSGHYRDLGNELAATNQIDKGLAYLKVVSKISSEKIMNALLSDHIESIKDSDNIKEYFDMFMKISTDNADKKAISELYKKVKNLTAGNPSPKFINYENNAGGKTSLDDLKGKYVYIDVWATWCGPCIGQIPALKKVEKKYHDKNIYFLSISIDNAKDHDKWKQMIIDKELGGIQLFADNEWRSQFVRDYQINGIPHFILLDPEGKIVKYSAPRPSDKKLIELFDSLSI
jgi:thiol-disulfide isomerase/thioredoxin